MNDLTTACKQCVFANYIGKTQIDCKLGRIKKFREKGVDIIEAEDLEENEFFVLEAWCNAYREQKWADEWTDQYDNLLVRLKEEYTPPLGFIVIINDDPAEKIASEAEQSVLLDGLGKTLTGIKEIEGLPSYIIIVNNSSIGHLRVVNTSQEQLEDSDIEYKVSNVIAPNLTDWECIDLVFSNVKNGYYSILQSGKVPKKDIISLINNRVNVELDSVGYIKGYDGINGTTVQAVIHKFLNGHYERTLLEKIEAMQKDDDFEGEGMDVVRTWKELENG